MGNNRRVVLAERPKYFVPTESCFRMDAAPMPQLTEDGQVLLQTTWLAVESMGLTRVQRVSAVQKDPIKLKDPMMGSAVGRVIESRHPRFKPGDFASGLWGWQEFAVVKGERLRNLDFGPQRPSLALGALGYSGFAADCALEIIAPPVAGETVVVGTALGNFGHLAAQIAKLKGCRVVGIVGSAERRQLALEKLRLDACVDRTTRDFKAQLAAACPKGVDVYLETYGGRALEAVMPLMNLHSRFAAVGQMATVFRGELPYKGRCQATTAFISEVIARRITVRGLVTTDHVKGRVKAFDNKMKAWIDEGKIKPMEDIIVGLENAPAAFVGVFEGKNRGTRLVKVAD